MWVGFEKGGGGGGIESRGARGTEGADPPRGRRVRGGSSSGEAIRTSSVSSTGRRVSASVSLGTVGGANRELKREAGRQTSIGCGRDGAGAGARAVGRSKRGRREGGRVSADGRAQSGGGDGTHRRWRRRHRLLLLLLEGTRGG